MRAQENLQNGSHQKSGTREALLEAVENTDISFFSPNFEVRFGEITSKPHPGRTIQDIYIEANEYALKQPTALRHDIIKAYRERHPGTRQFSARCREALDYYIANRAAK